MTQLSFGVWLKRRRRGLGWTQQELAALINCSTVMLKKIEAEERRPSAQIAGRLAEIFDIPSQERENFVRFARGDWQAIPIAEREAVPWRHTVATPRSNLPASVTSLVGRKNEIAILREYLSDESKRLITLTGPPGIGKTRLSIEAPRGILSDFIDGVFFVPLAALDQPFLIASTIARALGYAEAKKRPVQQQLEDGIGDKSILMILDNCEHIIEDVASLISILLSACPHLKILTTSREPLRIPGEWLYSVRPLDVPNEPSAMNLQTSSEFSALRLFAERAQAVRSDFSLDIENMRVVASICKQLDGIPLAIELIAARIRLLTPEALLSGMSDQFILSANGMRAASARQKTLNDAIGWSYDLLSVEERTLFVFLSVFSGGFTLEAAELLFSKTVSEKSVSDLIVALMDKSLLQPSFDHQEHSQRRFNMLVTIQQFALDRLRRMNAETEARNWHLDYFLNLAELADEKIHGPSQVEWIDRLDKEMDNFRSAFEWCLVQHNTQKTLCLVSALSWFLGLWHHNSELRSWFDRARNLERINGHPALYARLLNHMGYSSWLAGDFQHARSMLEESCAIWRTLGEVGNDGLSEGLYVLGMVIHSIDADYETAQSLFQQSLELYEQNGNQWGTAVTLFNLGWVNDHRNNDELAQQLLEQSLDIFSQIGDLWGMGSASQFLGQFFLKVGNYEKAAKYFHQHLAIDEKLKFKPGIVIALGNLGDLYRFQSNLKQAEQYYLKSLTLSREYGLRIDRGYNLYALGMLGLQRDDYAFAKQYIIHYFESGSSVSRILAACDLCMGMAAVAGGMKLPERSAKLWGAAQKLLQMIDIPYTPFDRAIFDRLIEIAKNQLGETRFEAEISEARAMTMEQAITYALEDVES